ENSRAVGLIVYRPIGSFESTHGFVAIKADQQGVAELPGVFQISDVAEVEEVEAPIRDDQPLALLAQCVAPLGELSGGDNFLAEAHAGAAAGGIARSAGRFHT